MRRLIAVAALAAAAATPAVAEELWTWPVASFDRLRIEGPVDVTVATGSPAARATAPDRATLARLSIAREGTTLIVRLTGAPPAGFATVTAIATEAAAAVRVALAVPRLTAVSHQSAGRATLARLAGDRVDVASTGGGTVEVAAVEARGLDATLVGGGTMSLAGRATRARLVLNGDGRLDAGALATQEAVLSLVGEGELRGMARAAAQVVAGPAAGRVVVTGGARCAIRARGEAQVRCDR